MRLLYFTQGFSPHDQRFLTALAESGHEVFFLRLDGEIPTDLPQGIVEVTLPGLRTDLAKKSYTVIVRKLGALLQELKPQLVHAGPLQGPAWLAARTGFSPLVSMSWGSDLLVEADKNRLMRWRTTFILSKTTVLLADCRAVANKAASFRFPPERIKVFPWGVDLDFFVPEGTAPLRRRLKWQKSLVFLCSRSMEPLYGVDVVVQAFTRMAATHPKARLLLMGTGSQEGLLRAMVSDAGVDDRVYFGGFAPLQDLPGIYRSADVYVSASHSDGSSVSLMEALACGKPALVSDIPGNREWIQPGEQGWLFKDGNSEELAARMSEICENGVDANSSLNARQLAEKRADWKQNFRQLLNAYDLAVGNLPVEQRQG